MAFVNNLEKRMTKNGVGIFSKVLIPKDTIIFEFIGEIIEAKDMPENITPENDYYLQVTPDKFLGPSGSFDDFINHSCAPNCGVIVIGHRALLITLHQILPGTQITFDYSTTSTEDDWKMDCKCGAYNCRGVISSYKTLDEDTRKKYEEMHIVPKYVQESVK